MASMFARFDSSRFDFFPLGLSKEKSLRFKKSSSPEAEEYLTRNQCCQPEILRAVMELSLKGLDTVKLKMESI